jgi:homocysteine S-methyltransferase
MAGVTLEARQQAWQSWRDAASSGLIGYEQLLQRIEVPDQGSEPILILDGGLGTTLEDEYHVTFSSSSTPTWSSHLLTSSPETLLKVHKSFVEAGADILLTATYQASFEGFSSTSRNDSNTTANKTGSFYSREEAKRLMCSAVPLARSAFGNNKKGIIALSLGAYGATTIPSTEYTGIYPPMEGKLALERWHTQRMMTFEQHLETWEDVDLVAFETLPRDDEILAVRGAMRLLSRQKPFWISCVFPNDDEKLPDGSEIIDITRSMLFRVAFKETIFSYPPVPMGIGINCTKVQKLDSLIRKFEDAAALLHMPLPHLVIYPDGAHDLTYDSTSQIWIPINDATVVRQWDEELFSIVQNVRTREKWAGVIVGGCCKTKPQHISRLRERIKHIK